MSESSPSWTLQSPIHHVPGIRVEQAELLERLGLHCVEDLLYFAPREVIDLSLVRSVDDLQEGELQSVRGHVIDLEIKPLRRGRTMTAALLETGNGRVRGLWFNQPWMMRVLQRNQMVIWTEKPKQKDGQWEMSHPQLQWIEEADAADFELDEPDETDETSQGEEQTHQLAAFTRYPLTEGLTLPHLRKIIRQVVPASLCLLEDRIPERMRRTMEIDELSTVIEQLHFPASKQEFQKALKRLTLEELVEYQIGLYIRRQSRLESGQAPVLKQTSKIDARIRKLFPFQFTQGQEEAIEDICQDLAQPAPMHRLLQADVGAGKTAIALYAMLLCIAAGYQTALMAPTEVLAEQHWETIDELLNHSRVKRAMLTGQIKGADREQRLQELSSGQLQLVVGTQALIQKSVHYHSLGLVVVDEQHKFGVVQRTMFQSEHTTPHTLVMTATPIPRSLCLTQYGDLELSVVRDLPPGRQPVVTSVVSTLQLEKKMWDFIRQQIQNGRQAFVVCSRISSEQEGPVGVEALYAELQQRELKGLRVGVIHGQQSKEQQQQTMDDFRERQLDVVVATSVIEVGVDIPNATLMVIQDAERFGLSQLHQMRGRVGRGKFRGYCWLMTQQPSGPALDRLTNFADTEDGFAIAEQDFAMRGPGNMLGTQQHGKLPFQYAELPRDEQLVKESRHIAAALMRSGKFHTPDYAALKARVWHLYGQLMSLPRSG